MSEGQRKARGEQRWLAIWAITCFGLGLWQPGVSPPELWFAIGFTALIASSVIQAMRALFAEHLSRRQEP